MERERQERRELGEEEEQRGRDRILVQNYVRENEVYKTWIK